MYAKLVSAHAAYVFTMKPTIIEYDSARYNFREWACEVLGVNDLEAIHCLNKVKTLSLIHI